MRVRVLFLGVGGALLGCRGPALPGVEVARVNGVALMDAELRGSQKDVQVLVSREVLAQAARRQKLQEDPAVLFRLREAEREVLAQALEQRALAKATDEGALRAYHKEHAAELVTERVHVRHILVPLGARTETAARAEADSALARIRGGQGFVAVAADVAARVGLPPPRDPGWLTRESVDPAFFTAARTLKRGEVAGPVQTASGFHILEALDDPETVVPAFEEVRGRLAAEAAQRAHADLLNRARDGMTIDVKARGAELGDAR